MPRQAVALRASTVDSVWSGTQDQCHRPLESAISILSRIGGRVILEPEAAGEAEAAVGDEDRTVEVGPGVAEHEEGEVDDVVDRADAAGSGSWTASRSASSPGKSRRAPSVSPIGPGAIALTRMPCGPHSTASVRVIASTAALAAATWTWPGVPP